MRGQKRDKIGQTRGRGEKKREGVERREWKRRQGEAGEGEQRREEGEGKEREDERRSRVDKREGQESRNLREGEGHQSTTNHYKVQDVPQVTEVGTLMQDQPKVHHLRIERGGGGRRRASEEENERKREAGENKNTIKKVKSTCSLSSLHDVYIFYFK